MYTLNIYFETFISFLFNTIHTAQCTTYNFTDEILYSLCKCMRICILLYVVHALKNMWKLYFSQHIQLKKSY